MQPALTIVDNRHYAALDVMQRVIANTGMTEKQWAQYEAVVSMELLKLRSAYPTQARNFSTEETNLMTAVWLETFIGVDPQALHEAIMRFIKADRKAFFPSPGQIMGFVEQIVGEQEEVRQHIISRERMKRYLSKMQEDNANDT